MHDQQQLRRSRLLYAVLITVVILLGLATRGRYRVLLPPWLIKHAGDALWALCVYLCGAFLLPTARSTRIALASLLFSFLIEFALLYQAPWINTIRHLHGLSLIFGTTFHWVNFLSYTAGIGLGMLGEWLVFSHRHR